MYGHVGDYTLRCHSYLCLNLTLQRYKEFLIYASFLATIFGVLRLFNFCVNVMLKSGKCLVVSIFIATFASSKKQLVLTFYFNKVYGY